MPRSATHPLAIRAGTAAQAVPRRGLSPTLRLTGILAIFVVVVRVPAPAHAVSQQGGIAINKWKAMDVCAVQAQAAFPDYTPESNAKREAKLKECLAGQNLPPRSTPPPR